MMPWAVGSIILGGPIDCFSLEPVFHTPGVIKITGNGAYLKGRKEMFI